jgi:thymidylate synthase ThyX
MNLNPPSVQFFMKEGEYLARTGTFAPTLEESVGKKFTDNEKIILGHFFTNTDRNIYAATDAMPNALWALLEGGYSRSSLSMRMRFLNIFEEMEDEHKKEKLAREDLVTVDEFAGKISSGGSLDLSFFLRKAEQFMRKWAVQYGHDSLKDSDNVRFAIENVTQCVTSPIEEARLGAYQEKSTRYVKFSKDSLVVPVGLEAMMDEIRDWNNLLMDNYESARPIVEKFVASRLNKSDFKTEAAFDRTVAAKTFDIVRYFLPNTLLTSLGVVWQTREAERHISRLMSDPREEVQSIGQALLEEGKKVSPGLLSHVEVNKYQRERSSDIAEQIKHLKIKSPSSEFGRSSDAVRLVQISPNIEEHIAAAILFESQKSNASYADLLSVCRDDRNLTEKVLHSYLGSRGKHDAWPLSTEPGQILFEVAVDLGAYRDLKRHRRNFFMVSPLSALGGIEYPEYVGSEPDLSEVKSNLENCAEKTEMLHKKILSSNPDHASYAVMFAHKQRMLWQMDPRQLAYVLELRTTPAGHQSYRTICQEMYNQIAPHLPILSQYIRVDMSRGEEGRKAAEEKTVEKLAKLGMDLKKTD